MKQNCMCDICLGKEGFVRIMYLEAASPEDRKHTKNEVIRQCLLANGIARELKGRPCRNRQELQKLEVNRQHKLSDRIITEYWKERLRNSR